VTDISLKYILFGEDRSASKAMRGLAGESEKTGSNLKRNVALGAAAASAAIIGFGKVSVDKFKEVGGETMGLMRTMGGTAEQASRLRFAAQQSGVSYETLSKSTGKLSKALDASLASGNATSAMIKTVGFDFRDAHGHIKPMYEILPQIAGRFAKMPNGAEKTALAIKLFGKAGADMLPFLNKGSTGISKLEKESDKFGLTLTGKNLDALKKSKASQREWNATLDGLRVQFGAQILPLLTSFTSFIRERLMPVILGVTGFFQRHHDVLVIVAGAIGLLILGMTASAAITKIHTIATNLHTAAMLVAKVATATWTGAQWLLNAAMEANPIGLVVLAIIGLVAVFVLAWKHSETFRMIVTAAFRMVKTVVADVVGWVRTNWPLLLAILTGPIGLAVLVIVRHWSAIKNGALEVKNWIVNRFAEVLNFFTGLPGKIGRLATGMFDGFKDAFRGAIDWIINAWDSLHFSIQIPSFHVKGTNMTLGGETLGFGVPYIQPFATGGIVTSPTLAMIGEAGPEAVVPLGRGGFGNHVTIQLGVLMGDAKQAARILIGEMERISNSGSPLKIKLAG
jgi:hypothetical protein